MSKFKFPAVAAILLGCMMLANTAQAQAQTILTPHFTDKSIKIVTPEDASVCPEIHDGMIAIWVGYGKAVFANTRGEYVFGTNFPVATINSSNYADSPFSGGAAMVKRSPAGNYCILYPDGTYRDLPKEYFFATGFCEGYAVANTPKRRYLDTQGRMVFPALTPDGDIVNSKLSPLRDNRRLFYAGKYGYADEKGNVVIKPQFDRALDFSEGLAAVVVTENYVQKWGYIDLTGKMVIPATYNLEPGRFSEGLATVRIGKSDSDGDYEMAYIDKTGKRVMENKKWGLNEFHNGFAWVSQGCDKLCVIDREFKEVLDVTKDDYFEQNGNGFGVCYFKMYQIQDYQKKWGIDFPNGMQSLSQNGIADGGIYAPDGTLIYGAKDAKGERVYLHNMTEGDLFFCKVRMKDAPQLKEKDVTLECFINTQGEIVYYFEAGTEGFEGPTPTAAKAVSTPATPKVTIPEPPKTPQTPPTQPTSNTPVTESIKPGGSDDNKQQTPPVPEEDMLIKIIREKEDYLPQKNYAVVPGAFEALAEKTADNPIFKGQGGAIDASWVTHDLVRGEHLGVAASLPFYTVQEVMEQRKKDPHALSGVDFIHFWKVTLTDEGKKYLVPESEYSKGKIYNSSGATYLKPITYGEAKIGIAKGRTPQAMLSLPLNIGVVYQGTASFGRIVSIEKKDILAEYKQKGIDISKFTAKSIFTYEVKWEIDFKVETPFGNYNYFDNNSGLERNKKTTITIIDGEVTDYKTETYKIYK